MKMEHWTDEDTGDRYVSCSALQQGDYCGASYCEANILALEKEIEGAHVIFGNFYSRQLWLPDVGENRQIIEGLIDYPVYDEDKMSRVEEKWEIKAWNDYGVADLKGNYRDGWKDKYRREHPPRPALAECIDIGIIDGDIAYECYRRAMEEDNQYPEFQYSDASLPLDEISETFARLCVEYLQTLNDNDDVVILTIVEGLFDLEDEDERLVAADWCLDKGNDKVADELRRPKREVIAGL